MYADVSNFMLYVDCCASVTPSCVVVRRPCVPYLLSLAKLVFVWQSVAPSLHVRVVVVRLPSVRPST